MKTGFAISFATVLAMGFIAVLTTGCNLTDPFNTDFDDIEPAVMYQAKELITAPAAPTSLQIMTYNIKYGGARILFFFECGGERGLMSEEEVLINMEALVSKINQAEPDILLMQEVDVNAKRAAYVDQVQYLLDHTEMNYAAYASQWKADFVASDGIGKIDTGNAILSRWPLKDAKRLALPLIGDHDALTQYFYLKRNMLKARVDLDLAQELWIVDVHAAAFATDDTKQTHVDLFTQELRDLSADGAWVVGGGDLNCIPKGSERRTDFADDCFVDDRFAGDDYTGEDDWLDELYAEFTPAIALADFQADNTPYLSFTSNPHVGWTRKLDYLFTNGVWETGSALVHQSEDPAEGGHETLFLSDHAPMSVVLEVGP